jgi:probable F420-dependent oxidoreductase
MMAMAAAHIQSADFILMAPAPFVRPIVDRVAPGSYPSDCPVRDGPESADGDIEPGSPVVVSWQPSTLSWPISTLEKRDRFDMKIRIGVGAASAASTPEALGELVTGLDDLGFDSLWLSEVLTGPVIDPVVGLAWAAASNPRLKVGTTMLLPGRNVVRLAKQLASLDVLCKGRLLVTLVPGLTYAPEREAIGIEPKRRGAFIDEALPLLRRLWAGETVSHEGAAGSFRDVRLSPLPVQQPLEVWLGGTAPSALDRCGRLSDGWLPSLCTPDEAAAGRAVIEDIAARAGRSISSEHFGMSIGYARAPIDPATARTMAARRPRALELTPVGLPALRQLIERFIAVGFSKFVVRPVVSPASWRAELEALAAAVGDLQT